MHETQEFAGRGGRAVEFVPLDMQVIDLDLSPTLSR